MMSSIPITLAADFSSLTSTAALALVERWQAADPTGELVDRAFVLVPADTAREPAEGADAETWHILARAPRPGLWDELLATSGRAGRIVLTLLAPVEPNLDAVSMLCELLDRDDMFGAALARTACGDGCCIRTLSGRSGPPAEWAPRTVLADLPPFDVAGDVCQPCVAIRPIVLSDFADPDADVASLAGTVIRRLSLARRCGFRTVLANRAVVTVTGASCSAPPQAGPPIPASDAVQLTDFAIDSDREWRQFRGEAAARFERLAGRRLLARDGRRRPSLLLDLRNVRGSYNGTAFAALGVASGLHRADPAWDVAILAHPEGAEFHRFDERFTGWPILTAANTGDFDGAIRLSQPWHVQEMVDLHDAARVNAYLLLDTIAWDVVHAAPPWLDGTWQFLAAAADGLLFISDFSRQRFLARFELGGAVDEVCHLSLDPADFTHAGHMEVSFPDPYLFVVGNHLAHKDVLATVRTLTSAFPTWRIEALGAAATASGHVRTHESGRLTDGNVHALYANARVVVFPSFYEGFGFPVVTALAYGRTVVARRSPLLEEVASRSAPGGRVVPYENRDDLVDVVGRLLHEEPVPEIRVGSQLHGHSPRGWQAVGTQVDAFMRRLVADSPPGRWRERERLAAYIRATQTDG